MKEKQVLVIGLGKSGIATSNYLLQEGYHVTAVDALLDREDIQKWYREKKHLSLKVEKDSEPQEISSYDFVVVSPGIPQKHPLYKEALIKKQRIFSEAELVLQRIHQVCIGITGSNGKTTLTLFLHHLLNLAKIPSKAIGNVGVPFTEYLLHQDPKEVLVCELSSYQLETLSAQAFEIGILLDITPDHLDRYGTFEAYAEAKLNIVHCIKPGGKLFLSHKMMSLFKKEIQSCQSEVDMIPKEFSNGDKNSCLQLRKNREYCDFLDVAQERAFSLESLYIAKGIAQRYGISQRDLKEAIATFKKPPHRLELIAIINGVKFINDSKATNIESVIYAIKMIEGDILLIAGGKDKGLFFEEWKAFFGSKVKRVFAIGESAMKIKNALEDVYEVELCGDLEIATCRAFTCAKPNTSVLLSPGCASFDSYRDYMHRGESFREIVNVLNKRCSR